MKTFFTGFFIFFSALAFQQCANGSSREQYLKSLDSLEGSLTATTCHLLMADTAQITKALEVHAVYKLFLQNAIHDTINLREAECIRTFLNSCDQLNVFLSNRRKLMNRSELLLSQIRKLRLDIQENNIDLREASRFIQNETAPASQLMVLIHSEYKSFYRAHDAYSMSLPGTEDLIRQYNQGQLPDSRPKNQDF
ncbi:MAG TPA: hypothetical protein PLQ93_12230 [Bacteroidia bacterium]|nr:hypothetical protein [Bacteroidia bacterium]